MNTPLVSILVTTYNQEQYIAQTLEGILMQAVTFDYEIVIGEDCSTDHTRAVCREYAARYPQIVLIENNPNKGLLHNYFDTLLQCKGNYIADCAGDDVWIDPHKLQRQVDLLENDSEVVMVHTNWQNRIECTGEVEHNRFEHFWGRNRNKVEGCEMIPIQLTCVAPFLLVSSACYRRDSIVAFYHQHTHLFRDKRFYCEDVQLIFASLRQGKVAYLPQETTSYRVLDNSVSNALDIAKNCRFSLSMLQLRLAIANEFAIATPLLSSYYQAQFALACTYACKLQSRTPLLKAIILLDSNNISLSFTNKMKRALLAPPSLFKIVVMGYTCANRVYKKIKRRGV